MSNQPNHAPFTPLYSGVPEIHYDGKGNAFYLAPDGRWLPYNGPLTQLMQQAAPAPPFTQTPLNDKSRGGPDSPIEHAFPADQYQFALRPSGTAPHAIPIDPALIPLPRGPDIDLNLKGLKPSRKVGGSRRKGKERERAEHADKGKKRQRASSGSDNDSEPAAKRGRPQGSGNYSKDDVAKLFDLVEIELPVGQKGWKAIHRKYKKYAEQYRRPTRAAKALENKYKQYLKQKKPTGDAACPPEVKRAHELEDLINERVGTRDLSDSEFGDNSDGDSSDDDVEVVDRPAAAVRTAIARRNPTPPLRRKARASGTDLATKLANVFDPAAQKSRDDARSQRAFENTQLLAVSQQLRDAQALAESLRSQNSILQNHINDLERACDRAELKLEVLQMTGADDGARGRPRRRSRPQRSHKRVPGIERVGGKIRYDEDENIDPYWNTFDVNSRSHSRHTGSRRPISRRRTPTPGPSHRPISRRRTPTPGPSRLRPFPSISSRRLAIASTTQGPSSTVTGNAMELVVTPRRGPAVALVTSPATQKTSF